MRREFSSNLRAEPRDKKLKLKSLLQSRDSGGKPDLAQSQVVISWSFCTLKSSCCSPHCERGCKRKLRFWRKISQTAYYVITLCSVTWLGIRICTQWKTLLSKYKKQTRSERKNHSQDPNKNCQKSIIMSINIIYQFTNTTVFCEFLKSFQN